MRLTIFARLIFSFLMIIALLAVVSFIALTDNRQIVNSFTKGEQHYRTILIAATEASSFSKRAEGHLFMYLSLHDVADKESFIARCVSLKEQLEILDKNVQVPHVRDGLERLRLRALEILPLGRSLIDAHDQEVARTGHFRPEKHAELTKRLFATTSMVREASVELAESEVAWEADIKKAAIKEAEYLRVKLIWLGVLSSIVVLLLSYLFSRSISRPIAKLKTMAGEIGAGNFGVRADIASKDEIGILASSLNQMVEVLQESQQHLLAKEQLLLASNQRLKESEKRFWEVFNHMSSGVALYEAIDNGGDFVLRDFNPAAEKIEKVGRKDVLGKRVTEAFPGVKACGIFDVFLRVWQTETPEYFPQIMYRDERDPGSWRENWISKLPTGEIIAIYNDITERKLAAEAGRQADADLKRVLEWQTAIFEGSRDAIFVSDQDSRFIAVNSAACDLTGYSRGELLKMRIPDIHDHPDLVAYTKYHQRIFDGEEILSEAQILRRNGTKVDTEFNNRRISIVGTFYMHTSAREITERKQAMKALQNSEERYRSLFANMLDGFAYCKMIYDDHNQPADFVYLAVNSAFEQLTGLKDVVGKRVLEVIPDIKDSSPELFRRYSRVALTGKPEQFEIDFKPLNMMFSISVYSTRKGYFATVFENITERRRAEKLIEEERNLLRSIINAIPDEIVVKDLERKFVLANEGCLRALGKQTLEQVVGLRDEDLISERFARDAREKEIRVLTSGETLFNDIPEPRRNPNTGALERVIMSTKTPLHDHSGGTIGLVTVNRDVTELQRTLDALRESENRFRTVWDHSLDAKRLTDEDGNIVMVNQSFCQLFKKENEELVGHSLADSYLPKPDEHIVKDYCDRFRNRAIVPKLEAGVTIWNGEELSVEISNSFLTVPGQPEFLLSVFRDITERKRAEARVIATQEQLHKLAGHLQSVREEERKHLSQEFHDQLGQMLTALKMDLSMLNRAVTDPGRELSRQGIGMEIVSMTDMIDRIIGIIREIMSELRPEMLDQLGIVPTLEWEAERFQQHSGISCTFNSLVAISALDAKRSIALYRIFQEALTNVARHAQATRVEAVLRKDGDSLALEIKDNGVGIPADVELQSRSFGLIGMRERAILLGGTFEIRPAKGKGTSVLVRIPYEQRFADGGAAL